MSTTLPIINSEKLQYQQTRKKIKWMGIIGSVLLVVGGSTLILFPVVVSTIMKSQMVIASHPDGFLANMIDITSLWLDVPVPIEDSVYIFTIDNPEEFSRGAKAQLRQMGPYIYTHKLTKEIIEWGPNEKSVKYWLINSFKFEPDKTEGSLDDKVTIVNAPIYAMVGLTRNMLSKYLGTFAMVAGPVVFGFMNVLILTHGHSLMKELTVGQLIEGHRFNLLDTMDIFTKPLTWFGIQLPDTQMPGNRFGILHMRNFTKTGPYDVYTGKDGTNFLEMISYQNKPNLGFYDDPNCNKLNGTDGTSMGSFLTKNTDVYVFQGDFCRSLLARYKERSFVKGFIPAWRFALPKAMFAGPNLNPDNKCYCRTRDDYEKCDGIFDIGPCQWEVPMAISYPHLMYASKTIQSGVEGLSPDIEKHESYFDIEPTLGIPMNGAARIQINLLIKPNSFIVGFRQLREAVLPFVWLEIKVGLEGKFVWLMAMAVLPMLAVDYGSLFAFWGGLSLLTYTGVYAFNRRKILTKANTENETLVFTVEESDIAKMKQDKSANNGNFTNNVDPFIDPPIYSSVERKYSPRNRSEFGTQTSPSPSLEQNRLKFLMTPPGTAE